MVAIGMTPAAAIVAATHDGAEIAKFDTGLVAAGRNADFIVLDATRWKTFRIRTASTSFSGAARNCSAPKWRPNDRRSSRRRRQQRNRLFPADQARIARQGTVLSVPAASRARSGERTAPPRLERSDSEGRACTTQCCSHRFAPTGHCATAGAGVSTPPPPFPSAGPRPCSPPSAAW
jgi:hypothetical protein